VQFTLKKSEILRGNSTVEHLLQNCKKFEGKILRCYVTTKPREVRRFTPGVAVAFAVKKSLKRAVDRNYVRRRMREAYRLNKQLLLSQVQDSDPQIQILFVYSSPKSKEPQLPSYAGIRDDIIMLLSKISKGKLARSQ